MITVMAESQKLFVSEYASVGERDGSPSHETVTDDLTLAGCSTPIPESLSLQAVLPVSNAVGSQISLPRQTSASAGQGT